MRRSECLFRSLEKRDRGFTRSCGSLAGNSRCSFPGSTSGVTFTHVISWEDASLQPLAVSGVRSVLDPLFVDSSKAAYHLQPDSPAIYYSIPDRSPIWTAIHAAEPCTNPRRRSTSALMKCRAFHEAVVRHPTARSATASTIREPAADACVISGAPGQSAATVYTIPPTVTKTGSESV